MRTYHPEEWEIIHINGENEHYRVFGSWRGGFTSGDSWRLNSGITYVKEEGDFYIFGGESGSEYRCHKGTYGIRSSYNSGVLNGIIQNSDELKIDRLVDMPDVMGLFKNG